MNNTTWPKRKSGVSTLVRPRFKPGLLLEDEDLTAGVDYTRNLMRLMFRSLFGCGIICGLKVDAKLTCRGRKLTVTVSKGVALDGGGNPIEVPTAQTIEHDWDCQPPQWPVWVALCYVEKCCRPRDVSCSIDGDGSIVQTRSLDGFELRLYDKRPDCACTCQPPEAAPPPASHGKCCSEAPPAGIPARSSALGEGPAASPPAPDGTRLMRREEPPDTHCECYEGDLQDPAPCDCDCDCDCDCVIIGLVSEGTNKEKPEELALDKRVRRFIRPVPAGYLPCLGPRRASYPPAGKVPEPAPVEPAPRPEPVPAPRPAPPMDGPN